MRAIHCVPRGPASVAANPPNVSLPQLDLYLLDCPVELERCAVEVFERHGRTEVDADIEGLARGKRPRHRPVNCCAGDFLVIHLEDDVCRMPGWAIVSLTSILCFPGAILLSLFAVVRSMISMLYS